ncbi:hypothetical protein GE09DRAFT_70106 [Coniochaeta sp. 2T2.1]|nr:hypothetical protein GE09DRAFT_70106 [Coniochaeta sp. 2T2.1]
MEYTNGGTAREQPRLNWGDDLSSHASETGRGGRWDWNSQYRDYVQERDGKILKYTEYQRDAANAVNARSTSRPGTAYGPRPQDEGSSSARVSPVNADGDSSLGEGKQLEQLEQLSSLSLGPGPQLPPSPEEQPTRILRPYETPLDPRFRVVEKPRRFFAIGRIFKAVWFEPGTQQQSATADPEVNWTAACPAFHEEKPFAKFRWFIVVRKRLHHSLCFTITTFGGRGATKASRGRAKDFVVLYPAVIEPPDPWPEEEIERNPLAVIIEEGQQYLSPAARVDCGRIYTVEDNIRVMKIGRIHPDSLGDLEEYYKGSVE